MFDPVHGAGMGVLLRNALISRFDPRLTPNRPAARFANNDGRLRFYCT